jgi:hypothetical protein
MANNDPCGGGYQGYAGQSYAGYGSDINSIRNRLAMGAASGQYVHRSHSEQVARRCAPFGCSLRQPLRYSGRRSRARLARRPTRNASRHITTRYHVNIRVVSASDASGSSRSPAESRLRRTNWSISTSRNSNNKQRSPFRRRARCRCMRRAAAERDGSFGAGDVSACL